MRPQNIGLVILFVLFAPSIPLHAQTTCDMDALKAQQRDVATIQRLENAWTVAYLKADTNFELCLLSKDFTEIVRSGEVKFLSDELAFARKNEGKNLPIPKLPEPTVLLHDNVAVAYGTSQSTGTRRQNQRNPLRRLLRLGKREVARILRTANFC